MTIADPRLRARRARRGAARDDRRDLLSKRLEWPLPRSAGRCVTITAAVSAGTKEAEAAKAFIAYLRSTEAAAVIKSKGMTPS